MAITVPTNFDVATNLPIDERTVVADIAARDAIASNVRYDGLIVYVEATNENWQLQTGITNSDWVDISASGGGGGTWGSITGTLSNQTDLQGELDLRLTDAPSDGNGYIRQDGTWVQNPLGQQTGGDLEWANVSLLMPMVGTDEDTTAPDESLLDNDGTILNGGKLDDAVLRYSATSLLLDGSNDHIAQPDIDGYDFGTGDFTIECDIYWGGADNDYQCILASAAATYVTGANYLIMYGPTAPLTADRNRIAFGGQNLDPSNEWVVRSTSTLSTNTWYHIGVSRVGGTMYLAIDGTVEDTNGNTSAIDMSFNGNMYIGRNGWDAGTSSYFDGRIANLRITKGVGRFSASYTAPTEAFPIGPATYGGGDAANGIIIVADQTERNAIPPGDRYEGMLVYVDADDETYQLQGGIGDIHWDILGSGFTGNENLDGGAWT